jgi:beta-ribofuranosylaminobenzene 5'-phosphate synthase
MNNRTNVKIVTPSRLHFGLIDLSGTLGRIDGGIGVALSQPNVILTAAFSDSDSDRVTGDSGKSREIVELVGRIKTYFDLTDHFKITLEETIPGHVGLGGTTQLYLAVARAIAELCSLDVSTRELGICVARGGTSGIGVAAFEGGGLILDFGHSFGVLKQKQSFMPSSKAKAPPPHFLRFSVPDDWFFVCGIPRAERVHGSRESSIFEKYCPIESEDVACLCHLLLMKIVPAAVECDIESFGEGLNRMQFLGFKKIEIDLQRDVVKKLMVALSERAFGAGLSSFGPTVYALAQGMDHARELSRIAKGFCETVIISSVCRGGAHVTFE